MSEFAYQDPFPVAPDSTKYRPITSEFVSTATFEGQEILKVAPEALTELAREAFRDVSFLYRTSHLEKVAAILDDPEASPNDRGVAMALLRNASIASDFRLPMCQDTGTATVVGQEGPARLDRRQGRGMDRPRDFRDLSEGESAVLPDRTHDDVSGNQLRDEPAGTDRYLRRSWGEVRVPLRRQGGRVGQQVDALPGDQGPAQPREPRSVPRPEASLARHGGVPAVSPGGRDRGDLGRGDDEDREARQHGSPRLSADPGQCHGPGLPRPGAGSEGHGAGPQERDRRPVRWQVFRARRPSHPTATPRGLLPGRDRRLLLGGSEYQGPHRPRRTLDRGPRAQSRSVHTRPQSRWNSTRHTGSRSTSIARWSKSWRTCRGIGSAPPCG